MLKCFNDEFLQKHSFLLKNTLTDALELCGLLLFGLSFWRHPFTAEDQSVSKWCNAKILQICSHEGTYSYVPWMAWGWVHFQHFWVRCFFKDLYYCVPGRAVQEVARLWLTDRFGKMMTDWMRHLLALWRQTSHLPHLSPSVTTGSTACAPLAQTPLKL